MLNVPARAPSLRGLAAFERIAHPSVTAGAEQEDPGSSIRRSWVTALAGALCATLLDSNRHHQQEPARLDDRTAARPLHPRPDDLRPAPARLRPHLPHPAGIEHTNRYVLTPRRHPGRRLLHQAAQPAAPAPAGPPTSPRRGRLPISKTLILCHLRHSGCSTPSSNSDGDKYPSTFSYPRAVVVHLDVLEGGMPYVREALPGMQSG